MVQVKTDKAVAEIFRPIKERAELLDDQGTLLGYFEPVDEDELYRRAASKFDPEEIRRRKQAGGPGYTIEEVMERLRSLGDA